MKRKNKLYPELQESRYDAIFAYISTVMLGILVAGLILKLSAG